MTSEPRRAPAAATETLESGEDLILLTGAPGSKWSGVAHAISFADQINNSDVRLDRSYPATRAPLHFGNYFGPGMEYGKDFDHLETLSKSELLAQFRLPFAAPGGVRLLKSHLFARHLTFLAAMLPKAHFVLVYRKDEECLDWWLEAGGFSITFPDYSWYREVENMRAQIAADNRAILQFVEQRGLRLSRLRSLRPLFDALGLTLSRTKLARLGASDFERQHGFGISDPEELERHLHSRARLARLAFC